MNYLSLNEADAGFVMENGTVDLNRNFVVICGFAGVGKSTLAEKTKGTAWEVIDLESSDFDKAGFPDNYFGKLRSLRDTAKMEGKHILVCCSAHPEVQEGLARYGFKPIYVSPDPELKPEYTERYYSRKNHPAPVDVIVDHFEEWVAAMRKLPGMHIHLHEGQFLGDRVVAE